VFRSSIQQKKGNILVWQ